MAKSSVYSTYQHNVSWENHGYAQIVRDGGTAYLSGQFAHEGEKLVADGDFAAQCDAAFANLDKCLEECGGTRDQVVHSEVLVVDLSTNMEVLTAKHKQYFGSRRPACTVWGVKELFFPCMMVEIKFTLRLDLPKDHKALLSNMPWEENFGMGQIVVCGPTVEVSGQFDFDDEGKPTAGEDFAAQCEQTFKNIDARLAQMGATCSQIVYTEVLVVDILDNMPTFNTAHKKFFGPHRPASTCWGVTELGEPQAKVEVKITVRLDLAKEPKTFAHAVEWEDAHNYSQAIVANVTAWISGQFGHDAEGNPVGQGGDFDWQCEAAFAEKS